MAVGLVVQHVTRVRTFIVMFKESAESKCYQCPGIVNLIYLPSTIMLCFCMQGSSLKFGLAYYNVIDLTLV